MTDLEFQQLLDKFLNYECSEKEIMAIEEWYAQINNKKATEIDKESLLEIQKELLKSIHEKIDKVVVGMPRPRMSIMPLLKWSAAAVLAIVFGVSYFYYNYKIQGPLVNINNIDVPINKQWLQNKNTGQETKTILLEDGSIVVLKPASTIWYPPHFENAKREIALSGEAFFQIAKDPNRPLSVYTDRLTTKVLGTSFTIKAFKDDLSEVVEVRTGKVAVFENKSNNIQAYITPNQKITFVKNEKLLLKALVESPVLVENAKVEDFTFNGTPLESVIEKISKAYNIEIIMENKNVKGCPITASFNEQTLYSKIDLICKSIDATYELRETKIIIHGGTCEQ